MIILEEYDLKNDWYEPWLVQLCDYKEYNRDSAVLWSDYPNEYYFLRSFALVKPKE